MRSTGGFSTSLGYTGEWADPSGLAHLRWRYYQPNTGTFIAKDPLVEIPGVSTPNHRYAYVLSNPVNFTDPFGLWKLDDGLELSPGGIYGQGQLTIPGWPKGCDPIVLCAGGYLPDITTMPIFVPQLSLGVLHNDVTWATPITLQYWNPFMQTYSDVQMATHYIEAVKTFAERDILDKLGNPWCGVGEFMLPRNTNDWELVRFTSGTSFAFHGGLANIGLVAYATGVSAEQGIRPVSVTFDPTYSNEFFVAYALWFGQPPHERDQLDLLKIWNEAGQQRQEVNNYIELLTIGIQGLAGAAAYTQREYGVAIQEHSRLPGLFRAIINTRVSFEDIATEIVYTNFNYLSYAAGGWREHTVHRSSTR